MVLHVGTYYVCTYNRELYSSRNHLKTYIDVYSVPTRIRTPQYARRAVSVVVAVCRRRRRVTQSMPSTEKSKALNRKAASSSATTRELHSSAVHVLLAHAVWWPAAARSPGLRLASVRSVWSCLVFAVCFRTAEEPKSGDAEDGFPGFLSGVLFGW